MYSGTSKVTAGQTPARTGSTASRKLQVLLQYNSAASVCKFCDPQGDIPGRTPVQRLAGIMERVFTGNAQVAGLGNKAG